MRKSVFVLALLVSAFAGATSHARTHCRQPAITAAKIAAHGLKHLFDLNPVAETPDMITYDVTLADVMPDPGLTTTIEVTVSKTTCGLIESPIQK